MRVLIEKIKACYYILTSHTYYVFTLTKEPRPKKVFIENPTLFVDSVIIDFLNSKEYKEFKDKYDYNG